MGNRFDAGQNINITFQAFQINYGLQQGRLSAGRLLLSLGDRIK
jgi:hypothetical protein